MRNWRFLVKQIWLVGVLIVLNWNCALASTPDASVALQYVKANLQFDTNSAFKLLHPEAHQRMLKQANIRDAS
jgi:hypothetical protein